MYMTTIKMFTTLAIAAATLLASCGGASNKSGNTTETNEGTKPSTTVAIQYDYSVASKHPHSTTSYTQGLEYVDGVMWEGTGREGRSFLQRIDLKTGAVDVVASLPEDEFGEGITHFGNHIYQLTWLSEKAYVYDLKGNKIKTIPY